MEEITSPTASKERKMEADAPTQWRIVWALFASLGVVLPVFLLLPAPYGMLPFPVKLALYSQWTLTAAFFASSVFLLPVALYRTLIRPLRTAYPVYIVMILVVVTLCNIISVFNLPPFPSASISKATQSLGTCEFIQTPLSFCPNTPYIGYKAPRKTLVFASMCRSMTLLISTGQRRSTFCAT